MAISVQRRGEREKKRERRRKNYMFSEMTRRTTGFLLSQLILSIPADGAMADPLKELLFAFEW